MERNYFVCSVGRPGEGWDKENLTRCITSRSFVLEDHPRKGSVNEIKSGDLLILKHEQHLIGYGFATASLKVDENLAEWNLRCEVNSWIIGKPIHYYGIKDARESGSNYDTVKKVKRDFALEKIEEIGYPFE